MAEFQASATAKLIPDKIANDVLSRKKFLVFSLFIYDNINDMIYK